MTNDHDPQYPLASGSGLSPPPLEDLSDIVSWFARLPDDVDDEDRLPQHIEELIFPTTERLHPGPAVPEAAFRSNIFGHPAAEDPTGPSQSSFSEYGPGFSSSALEHPTAFNDLFDIGHLLPAAPASDAPDAPGITHNVSFSSGYGASQSVSEDPPITASTSGEVQANQSTGLRIFHSQRQRPRKPEWRAHVLHKYSIEIARHCLEPELWETWNGQLYINNSAFDDTDALYLRIDAQASESVARAPSPMCENCQRRKDKPYPRKGRNKDDQRSSEMSHLGRIYCDWPLEPLKKASEFFKGEIDFFIFCHPSHIDGKKCSLQSFRIFANLYKADGSPLASCTIPDEIISRTTAKNNTTTIHSRSGRRNPQPAYAASTVPTIVHFASEEGGESGDNPLDPPATVPSSSLPQRNIPSDVGARFSTLPSVPPFTPSIVESFPAPVWFNLTVPDKGYSGQFISFYGADFSPTVDYYAKFGELEPTLLFRQNPGLLEGAVPEWDKDGPVPVNIVTKEGIPLCRNKRRFVYIGRDHKIAEEGIKCASDKVNPGDALPDAKDDTRRLKDSKKAESACGSRPQEPRTQARRGGSVIGDEAGARDEMSKTLHSLEPTSELVDTDMQGLTYQDENGNFKPAVLRSWTNASAATSATVVAATASLKVIKAASRKPTAQSIVSRWLMSNYGSESPRRKRKRTRTSMETEGTEGTVGQWGMGGELLGTFNFLLSPEQVKIDEEDSPVVLTDAGGNDQQAAKRRRMEGSPQPHMETCSSPIS